MKFSHIFLPVLLISFLSTTNAAELTNAKINDQRYFTPNKGQLVDQKGQLCPEVLYTANVGAVRLYFTKKGVSMVFPRLQAADSTATPTHHHSLPDRLAAEYRTDLEFLNSNPLVQAEAFDPTGSYANYYYAHCPKGILNVRHYSTITYKNIYPNIDAVFTINGQGLKYNFIVKPGGDYKKIKYTYKGSDITVLNGTTVSVTNPLGKILETIPSVYQTSPLNAVKNLTAAIQVNNGELSYKLTAYNPLYELTIDPQLIFTTYYGGSGVDRAYDIELNSNQDILITGNTLSTNLPVTGFVGYSGPGTSSTNTFFGDAFIASFQRDGSTLNWATYAGGSDGDYAEELAIDANDNIFIAGSTYSTNLPYQNGLIDMDTYGGSPRPQGGDVYLAGFTSSGAHFWGTYLGGSDAEAAHGLEISANGNIVVTGHVYTNNATNGTGRDFPITAGAFQTAFGGGDYDAFLSVLSSDGQFLLFSTYYGGSLNDDFYGLATDNANNIILTGLTSSTNFPIHPANFYKNTNSGFDDATVVAFNASFTRTYATYLGGGNDDIGYAVKVNSNGEISTAGVTQSSNFPVLNAFGPNLNQTTAASGLKDGYMTVFNVNPKTLKWSTFVGGASDDEIAALEIDASDNSYITGNTASSNFPIPLHPQPSQPAKSAATDGFILKLNPDGVPLCGSYYGGNGNDFPRALSYSSGHAILTGYSNSTNLQQTAGSYDASTNGNDDAFVCDFDVSCAGECNINYDVMTYTTASTENWTVAANPFNPGSQVVSIYKTIRLLPGANVTATGLRIIFGENAKVIVERGAVLTLNKDTLTSVNCSQFMWKGIEVWGTNGVSQTEQPKQFGALYVNNSLIEHAHEAVNLFRKEFTVSGSETIDFNHTGGQIFAFNTTFRQNRRSVNFFPYNCPHPTDLLGLSDAPCHTPYHGFISGCRFLCEGPMKDALKYYDNSHGLVQGAYSFISMYGVRQIEIIDNLFKNTWQTTTNAVDLRAIGITSLDASYRAVKNTFNGLTYGILASATQVLFITADSNTFVNVQEGILGQSVRFSTITQNSFHIPSFNPSALYPMDTWGVKLEACHYFLNRNYFRALNLTNRRLGSIHQNSPIGRVWNNSYTDLSYGTVTEQDNPNIIIACNDYRNQTHAWAINPVIPGTFPAVQGGNTANDPPAGNRFFDACIKASLQHIRSNNAFDYNASLNNAPHCNTSNVKVIVNTGTTNVSCPSQGDPCPDGDLGCRVVYLKGLIALATDSAAKWLLEEELIQALLEAGQTGEAIEMLESRGTTAATKDLIVTCLHIGDYTKTGANLAAMDRSTAANENFYQLYTVLLNLAREGKTVQELDSGRYDTLKTVALSGTRHATTAQGILSFAYGERFDHSVEKFPELRIAADSSSSPSPLGRAGVGFNVPNPFSERTSIEIVVPATVQSAGLQIHTVLGNLVQTIPLINGQQTIELNASDFENGIYLYSLVLNGQVVKTHKMVVLK